MAAPDNGRLGELIEKFRQRGMDNGPDAEDCFDVVDLLSELRERRGQREPAEPGLFPPR